MTKFFSCLVLLIALPVASCGPQSGNKAQEPGIIYSDRSTDPGVVPANPASYSVMEDPNQRRVVFRDILHASGNQCQLVTEAVLKGGAHGNDLWRVTCADSGQWLVTFVSDTSKTVVSCRT